MNSASIPILRTPSELRARTAAWRKGGQRVALVPTMGALHAGHLSLVDAAREHATQVVVSIFVNPAQFAPNEDFDRYPRTEDDDVALLSNQGKTSVVYAPAASAMYAPGFATTVSVGGPAYGLESAARPHFFAGVATVVCKLLLQAQPDVALFGEKDYQQLAVIRQMVRDLDLPVEIIGCPTLREPDGLAMSSRNRYLTAEQRGIAAQLSAVMAVVAREIKAGAEPLSAAARGQANLLKAGFDAIDYLEVRDAQSLSTALSGQRRILIAARLGGVRLIDNGPV